MKVISWADPENHPGHYSPAVVSNGNVYISGQLPLDFKTGKVVEGGIALQTQQALENLKSVLALCQLELNHLVRVTIYISNVEHWGEVNAIYSQFLGAHKPARTIVPVNTMHYGSLIEIDAVAEEQPNSRIKNL